MKTLLASYAKPIQKHSLRIISFFVLLLLTFSVNAIGQTTESKVDYIEHIYFSGKNKEGMNNSIQDALAQLELAKQATTSQAAQYGFLSGIKEKALAADKSCDVADMLAAGIYALDPNEAKSQGIPQPSSKTTANLSSVISSTQSISNSTSNLASDSWVLSNGNINTYGRASTVAGGAYKLGTGASAAGDAVNVVNEGKQLGKAFGIIKDKPCSSVPTKTMAIGEHVPQTNVAATPAATGAIAGTAASAGMASQAQAAPVSVTAYQNYDFRAGDKIIFADNFATDQDGEFPAHWDLISGQAVVNKVTAVPSFLLTDGNYCRVKPLMKTESYLTDNFSIEYDTYMTSGAYGLIIFMANAQNEDMNVNVTAEGATWSYSNTKTLSGSSPKEIQSENYFNKWHHIAIAYKNDQLKVYIDQYRVLTVPHCGMKPGNVSCAGIGDQNNPIIFKDFKIADGASMNMLDAIMTTGKFVTHGINFDVNKATLKPESMGVINDLVKYMQANASLKLEIDGHTDSDGADAANLTLSQQRADAVKAAMVAEGIDASRLTTKGFGESKPVGTNDTPEGKAMNRRVEFIKTS